MDPATQELTRNLIEWRNGNQAAIEKILPVIYNELRRTARRYLRRENSDISLQTSGLLFTADDKHLISAGMDQSVKMRTWEAR